MDDADAGINWGAERLLKSIKQCKLDCRKTSNWAKCIKNHCQKNPGQGGGAGSDRKNCLDKARDECWKDQGKECCLDSTERGLFCEVKQNVLGRKVPVCLSQEDIEAKCAFVVGATCPEHKCCGPLECIDNKCAQCISTRGVPTDFEKAECCPSLNLEKQDGICYPNACINNTECGEPPNNICVYGKCSYGTRPTGSQCDDHADCLAGYCVAQVCTDECLNNGDCGSNICVE